MKEKVIKGERSDDAPNDIICQSDINGNIKPPKKPKLSWLSSLCNCFRSEDLNYLTQNDQTLLLPQTADNLNKNTLVLDLDETLVHSSFTKTKSDITMNININNEIFNIYVLKRPGVDEFLRKCSELFEIIIFTASLPSYADPLLDSLDPNNLISFRLFRDSCTLVSGGFVKDLSRLGRDLNHVLIIDVKFI